MTARILTPISNSNRMRLYREFGALLQHLSDINHTDNVVAEQAEYLACRALNLHRDPITGSDAANKHGIRFEVKSCRIARTHKSRQLSQLLNLDKKPFAFLAGVLFDRNMNVQGACLIPHALVLKHARLKKPGHWTFNLDDKVWLYPGVQDITQRLIVAQNAP